MRKKSLDIVVGVMVSIVSSMLFAAVEDYARPDINITVAGEESVDVGKPETQIDVAPSGALALDAPKNDVFVRVQEGGSVALKALRNNKSWHDKVALWLDASEEWTLEPEKNASGKVQTVTENGKAGAVIVRWHDRRKSQTEWLGYNDRDTKSNANGNIFPYVMPYVVSNGCNGLNYVSLGPYGSSRRLPFIKKVDGVEQTSGGEGNANSSYSLNAKYVMMVFGSQNGGGNAVISGKRGTTDLFPRMTISASGAEGPAASVPIFASSRPSRLDGVDVVPSSVGLNGGWQVFSFAPNKNVKVKDEYLDEMVTGLGWNPFGRYGGQNYAEILIFTEMPTDLEIKSAELYLAEKWGISTYSKPNEGEVRLFGKGAATVESGSVRLGGMFSGTLTVAEGAELVLSDAKCAPNVPVSGMTGWFDPNRADSRVLNRKQFGNSSVDIVDKLVNIAAGADDNPRFDLVAHSRGSAAISETRGWGTEMVWCDYSTNKIHGVCNGTTLRFNDANDGESNCLPVRTGFMMLDTRAQGGTPFLDTSVYSLNSSPNSRYVVGRNVKSPIFNIRDKDAAFITNSPAYLNGVSVESGKHTFNARPELFSFSFSQNVPIRCIGAWQQTVAYTVDPDVELRHGEIIFYPTELSASERKDTEAYLMSKWLGITPKGYGKPQNMTVTGAGTVKTANGRMRPKIAETFTGRMEISDDVLTFSFDGSSVLEDAISIANGELATSEAVTVNLSFASRPEAGVYVLVSAKTWNAATVELGEIEGPGSSTVNCSVRRDGNVLYLTVTHPGMRVIVR